MKRSKFLASVLLLLSLGCASMPTPEEKIAVGLAIADIATTAYALNHGHVELNPILKGGDKEETVARAIVLNAVLHWIQHKYLCRYTTAMQKKWWRIVIGVRAVPVMWNIKEISE